MCILNKFSTFRKLTSVIVVLNTPEPVVYDILEAKSSRISSNQIESIVNKIIQENSKHIFYPIVCKNSDNLEFNKQPFADEHVSWYTCNKHVLNLLIRALMKLDIFKQVLQKYKAIAGEIPLGKTFCIQPNKCKLLYANLTRMLESKPVIEKLATSKNSQIKNKSFILDENGFWAHIHLFVNLIRPIINWMNKMLPESCISSVVECYSDLRETFEKVVNERNTCILECLDKHRTLAISEVHKAASLLDPRYMGTNLSADEVIDAIEFINKLSQIQPDTKANKIIYDIAAYRTKQGIWGKKFVWDSLSDPELPAIIWWQSMCSSTELCKIAVNVLSCPPVTIPMKHTARNSNSEIFRKTEYIKHNTRLFTNDTTENNQNDDISESSDSESDY